MKFRKSPVAQCTGLLSLTLWGWGCCGRSNVLCTSILVCLIFSGTLTPVASAAIDVNSLQDHAHLQNLAQSRVWQILLHYRTDTYGNQVSLVDDPRFFLAANGKTDPQAELDATIAEMLLAPDTQNPGKHVICRFPARSKWLTETLEISAEDLPAATCPELDEALNKIAPQRAVLIFAGNHNSSPGSMFGHTLIAIEGRYDNRLLSYAVNYAARTDEPISFSYAAKGLFGLYPGYYSLLPYYLKVREYNDLERRDVWEYALDLSPSEVKRMTLHIWELRDIFSDYYFFDENCSYNLLFLIEAARPELNLTEASRPWVIPLDTVRTVANSGLIRDVRYRPSKATRIAALAGRMDRNETKLALSLLDGRFGIPEFSDSDLDVASKIRILDAAIETADFQYAHKELNLVTNPQRSLEFQRSRNQINNSEDKHLTISDPGRPDYGHGSNRLSLGLGVRDDDLYQELRLRPAYHDLLDPDQGYLVGSQIDFLNIAFRYYPERKQAELQSLDLMDIVSLSPHNAFFQPVSWKMCTGFHQRKFDDGDDHLTYRLNPGGGVTFGDNLKMLYALIETDVLLSGRFRDGFGLGLGGSTGILTSILPNWKLLFSARHLWYELGDAHRSLEFSLRQNWQINEKLSLALEVGRERTFDNYSTDSTLLLNYYW